MTHSSPVADLFPEEAWPGGKTAEFIREQQELGLNYPDTPSKNPNGYIFRGELDYVRPLECTLERAARRKANVSRSGSLDSETIKSVEKESILHFQNGGGGIVAQRLKAMADARLATVRKVLQEKKVPVPESVWNDPRIDEKHPFTETFWWLAVMQHYGHPTRLIDFSTDFAIALFMAVQQFRGCSSLANVRSADLIIYCFPCRYADDTTDQNKTPHLPPENMNDALGAKIGLPGFTDQSHDSRQKWGWDRPYFDTPRLWVQKGMFVYSFDSLETPLTGEQESWLVRNLRQKETDPFGIKAMRQQFSPKRIRISQRDVAEIATHLESFYGLTQATAYLDYTQCGKD